MSSERATTVPWKVELETCPVGQKLEFSGFRAGQGGKPVPLALFIGHFAETRARYLAPLSSVAALVTA